MDRTKEAIALLGTGIVVGAVLMLLLFTSGWEANGITVGPISLVRPRPSNGQAAAPNQPILPPSAPTLLVPTATLVSVPQPLSPTSPLAPTIRPSDTPAPLPTVKPTDTPIPTPLPLTSPGTVLKDGETWYAEGWSLTVTNFDYTQFIGTNSPDLKFALQNRTGRRVVVPAFDARQTKIIGDTGQTYRPCEGSSLYVRQTDMAPGQKLEWTWRFCWDSLISSTRRLTLTVPDIADIIKNARWQVEIPRP